MFSFDDELYLNDILIIFWDHAIHKIFASMNQYFNDKLSLFLAKVTFDESEENQLSYFQKGYFLKKSLKMLLAI